jgi:hypothetical protein
VIVSTGFGTGAEAGTVGAGWAATTACSGSGPSCCDCSRGVGVGVSVGAGTGVLTGVPVGLTGVAVGGTGGGLPHAVARHTTTANMAGTDR